MVEALARDATGMAGARRAAMHSAVDDPARGMTCHQRAKYERELAILDLTDAAQAMARCRPDGGDGLPTDRSLLDLASALYASADRHRELAERFDAEDVDVDSGAIWR